MVRLLLYNIEYCEGIQGRWYEYLQFWKVLKAPKGLDLKMIEELRKLKPDIAALVEVDTGSLRAMKDEVVNFSNGMHLTNFVEKVKYPIQGWLSLFHYIPILNKQGNAILSRYKLNDVKYHVLHEGTKRVVIETTVYCPHKITMLLAHLSLGKSTRQKQIQELINIVNNIDTNVILMGDFNTYCGEEEVKELLDKTHLKKTTKIEECTFPAFCPRYKLDYVLTSDCISIKDYKIIKYEFSDHLPLLVDFDVK